jgi:glycosyltransferase involved in cell wall biosynthesis
MASGRPVVAYGRGGAVETVANHLSGVFFEQQTVEDISSAIRELSQIDIDQNKIVTHAKRFGRDQFFQKMHSHIDGLLAQRRGAPLPNSLQMEPRHIASLAS